MGVMIDGEYRGQLTMEMCHSLSSVKIVTDAPKDNGGDAKSFSPTDLLAASTVSCMMTIMALEAKKLKVDLTGMKSQVEKIMSSDLPRRVAGLDIKVWLPASLSVAIRQHLEEKAAGCPVLLSIHPSIQVTKTFLTT